MKLFTPLLAIPGLALGLLACNPLSPADYGQRKDPGDAVIVRLKIHVRHGVACESDVEPEFIGMARGRLHADAGGDTGEHHHKVTPRVFSRASRSVLVKRPTSSWC